MGVRHSCHQAPSESLLAKQNNLQWSQPQSSYSASVDGQLIGKSHKAVRHIGSRGSIAVTPKSAPAFSQVFARIIADLLLPALLAVSSATPGSRLPATNEGEHFVCPLPGTHASGSSAAPPLLPWIVEINPATLSPSTTSPAQPIKQQPPSSAHCGLRGCATKQAANPFLLIMQVGSSYPTSTKKSSNYCLVQLPSPQCCCLLVTECVNVVRASLLLSGDVGTNPGPDILAELKKLSQGQSAILSEMQGLKSQIATTNQTITDLGNRIADLENHCQNLLTLRAKVDAINTNTTELTHRVYDIDGRLDVIENRSRRDNLIFYNLPDTNPKETYTQSEEIIIQHGLERLQLTIEPKDIERAHRLGRHTNNNKRPIIVKLSSFKTKESILSNGLKLKGTNFSIGEDFTHPVRIARKELVAFAI
ncbi:uncharacterized protein LOC119165510 isoform X1 [Rhipicephalus microplus]|uniref:uncharacterized protein LOC119165510 isoform X1 n=1 Tax=Rhipicephalus microplus TaxID=6941 RepID=UPI003F6B3552